MLSSKLGGQRYFAMYMYYMAIPNSCSTWDWEFLHFHCLCFYLLALLCATAQQSYCHHAGICHASIKLIFSETVKRINAKL